MGYNCNKFIFENVCLTPYNQSKAGCIQIFTTPEKKAFENIARKGENAGNQHFLLFPQCFLPNQQYKSSFELPLKCHLQILLIWTGLKFCRLVTS